jgi:anaerobic ribonucleoside-triphosphate reductase
MTRPKCPGQDTRYWTPDDIYEVLCPHCDSSMEFFKDESVLPCPDCGKEVRNPKIDLGCATWCASGEQCLCRLK